MFLPAALLRLNCLYGETTRALILRQRADLHPYESIVNTGMCPKPSQAAFALKTLKNRFYPAFGTGRCVASQVTPSCAVETCRCATSRILHPKACVCQYPFYRKIVPRPCYLLSNKNKIPVQRRENPIKSIGLLEVS